MEEVKKIDIIEALMSLVPTAQFSVITIDGKHTIEWLDTEQVEPTEEEINAEIARLEAEYKATQYQRDRKVEYDKLNQDEMRFDDAVNGTTTWIDAINEIKAKYPKA